MGSDGIRWDRVRHDGLTESIRDEGEEEPRAVQGAGNQPGAGEKYREKGKWLGKVKH